MEGDSCSYGPSAIDLIDVANYQADKGSIGGVGAMAFTARVMEQVMGEDGRPLLTPEEADRVVSCAAGLQRGLKAGVSLKKG